MYKINEDLIFDETEEYIRSLNPTSLKPVKWVCPVCGKENTTKFINVKNKGHSLCKGCARSRNKIEKMIGKKFGEITIVSFSHIIKMKNGALRSFCLCSCTCGGTITACTASIKSGNTTSCGCKKRKNGANHHRYNHKYSFEEREKDSFLRKNAEANLWRKQVKDVFGDACFLCGSSERIEVHHVESFKENKERRNDVQNGVCLCREHHLQYHLHFLGGSQVPATKESFTRYMEWYLCQLQNY